MRVIYIKSIRSIQSHASTGNHSTISLISSTAKCTTIPKPPTSKALIAVRNRGNISRFQSRIVITQ